MLTAEGLATLGREEKLGETYGGPCAAFEWQTTWIEMQQKLIIIAL